MASRYPFAVIKEKLHARRDEITDFAIGARRLTLPPELTEWLHSNPDLALRPASPDTVSEFKDAAASLLQQEYGVSLDHDQIVPMPGGRVAMTAIAACMLQPGDNVLVTEPGYPAFARLASHWHAGVCSVPLDPAQNFAPDLSVISAQELEKTRVFSLNYPNNPTGAVLSAAAQKAILDAAAQVGALVFNDNVYGPLTYATRPTSLLGCSSNVECIELHGLTKLYPLGPQGASFLAGSRATMRKISTYAEFAWSPKSALKIQATTWCFRDVGGRAKIKSFFQAQLKVLHQVLIDIGFEPYPVPAGIYALCRLPRSIGGRTVTTAEEAAVILMDEFDLAVVPWDPAPNHYLRFTSMYQPEDLERLRGLTEKLQVNQAPV